MSGLQPFSPLVAVVEMIGFSVSITFTLAVSEPVQWLASSTVTLIIYSTLHGDGVGMVAVMLSEVEELVWLVGVAKVTPGELTLSHV